MSVTFAGVALGDIIGFDEAGGTAQVSDRTTSTATLVGTGDNTRIVMRRDITGIDPGNLSFRCNGAPPFARTDIGLRGSLVFSVGGASYTLTAQLASIQRFGAAGGIVQGAYEFIFTG